MSPITQILLGAAAVSFVVFVAMSLTLGRRQGLPLPHKIAGGLAIGFALAAMAVQGPLRDEEGFTAVLKELTLPVTHGLPLLREPRADSERIRAVDRFESYSMSGRKENGYAQVRMLRDRQVGWLPESVVDPGVSEAWRRGRQAILAAARSFFPSLIRWRSVAMIAFGVALSGVLVWLFGRERADVYSQKIDLLSMFFAAISALGANIVLRQLIPFSQAVAAVERAGARGCWMIRYAMPSVIAALVANLLFGRCQKIAAGIELFFGVGIFFMLYFLWGSLAAWW